MVTEIKSRVLRGFATLNQVTDFVASVSEAFYTFKYGGDTSVRSEIINYTMGEFEDAGLTYIFDSPNPMFGANENLHKLYTKFHENDMLSRLAPLVHQFVALVKTYRGGYLGLKTKIFDKTLLRDLMGGQTFPTHAREFDVCSIGESGVGESWKTWEEFNQHLNVMVTQAQRRTNPFL